MATLKLIIAFFMSFFQLIAPLCSTAVEKATGTQFETWSAEQKFTRDYCTEIEKTPGRDFVILNIADVQLGDDEVYGEAGEMAEAMIAELIEENQPDLITLSGDNAWATMAYARIVDYVDSFGIPWAPVMGNHDGEGTIGEWWCAGLFENAENCLWKNGPEDMGWGNYIINITENGHIIHTLFMMDTHSDATWTKEDGTTVSGYDHIWPNQMEWYKWAVNGIAAIEGKVVESTCIYHIPDYEYNYALAEGKDADTTFGENHEAICSPPVSSGFFSVMKEMGSTKNVIVGHDHVNSSSILYQGIRLTYALKCGSGCYWEKEMSGGTTITINGNGNATVAHHYINSDDLSYGSDLVC